MDFVATRIDSSARRRYDLSYLWILSLSLSLGERNLVSTERKRGRSRVEGEFVIDGFCPRC